MARESKKETSKVRKALWRAAAIAVALGACTGVSVYLVHRYLVNDPKFVLYRVAQRFGLPVVPGWADWFNEELNRRGVIRPLIGLGCTPVLVSGTKKLFLKCIRSALRQKRIEVPNANGPVRWSLDNSFFHLSQNEGEDESRQEISEDNSTISREEAPLCESS